MLGDALPLPRPSPGSPEHLLRSSGKASVGSLPDGLPEPALTCPGELSWGPEHRGPPLPCRVPLFVCRPHSCQEGREDLHCVQRVVTCQFHYFCAQVVQTRLVALPPGSPPPRRVPTVLSARAVLRHRAVRLPLGFLCPALGPARTGVFRLPSVGPLVF